MPENYQVSEQNPMTLLDKAIILLGNFIALFYVIAVFITAYEVFMRYVRHQPTLWVFEVSVILIAAAMLYGGTYCMAGDSHIRVTLIRDKLPKRLRKINDIIVAFFTLLFCLALCYASWLILEKSIVNPFGGYRFETTGSSFNSPQPSMIKIFMMFVVILMAIQAFIQFIQVILCSEREASHG